MHSEAADAHATTTFSTDNVARTVTPQNIGVPNSIEILRNPDWSKLSLHELLSQPVIVSQGTVPDTSGGIFFQVFPYSTLLNTSQFHVDKIRGYLGVRATLVWRLVVNADKFTQGRLHMSYQPTNKYFVERRDHFSHISQLQHVELDLNTDTEVVLKVPHRGPYTHFDVTNRANDPGILRVSTYLPVSGNPWSYTLYASMEDIDLLGPTAVSTVAYEGNLEVEEQKDKPVSSKLTAISTAATAFGMVPMLTSICEPLAWATGIAANVVSAFGYSRPNTTVTPDVFLNREAAKLNQTDGTEYADPMAMTVTNKVKFTDKIGLTESDEMSFAYLCGIKTALFRFNYSVTTTVGTKLVEFPLAPFSMKCPSSVSGALVFSPMAYIANVFHKYHGSIGITIDLAKTVFHTGRLLVVFEPINPEGATPPVSRISNLNDAINCHKDVIDIRKGNTFTLKFPFTAMAPYLDVERPYGYVHIFVLNALVTESGTAPAFIQVGIKAHALEDMEFAGPTRPRYWPYLPDDASQEAFPQTRDPIVYQSGLEVKDGVIVDKMIGSSQVPTATTEYAELCVGEQIKSMKQLAMRSKLVRVVTGTGINPQVDPFTTDLFLDTNFGATIAPYQPWHDFYSYVGRMYAYARGGVVLTVHNESNDEAMLVSVVNDPVSTNIPFAGPAYDEWGLTHIIREGRTDRIYIPMYHKSYVRYNQSTLGSYNTIADGGSDLTYDNGLSQVRFTIRGINDGQPHDGWKLWRAAADDTQFGGFMATPFMVALNPWFAGQGTAQEDYKISTFSFPFS